MTTPPEFTGERFVPGADGEIVYEHVHRYAFARALVRGKRVMDAACGEGYGSALLAREAASVVGIDLDTATINHARERYKAVPGLSFAPASVAALPIGDGSIDVVVSFETIEHLPAIDQPRMLAEFARVLAPGGLLILSAPNRVEYSQRRGYVNPFHVHEHDRAELDRLVAVNFPVRRFYCQRIWLGSTIWREDGDRASVSAYNGDSSGVADASPPEAMYYVVLAGTEESAMPGRVAGISLFSDAAETELVRSNASAREVLRLDAILGERTSMLDKQSDHIRHLEGLVAYREALVVERDRQLEAQAARIAHLEQQERARDDRDAQAQGEIAELRTQLAQAHAAAAAQERIIDYRHGWHWWLKLPWLRVRSGLRRVRGE